MILEKKLKTLESLIQTLEDTPLSIDASIQHYKKALSTTHAIVEILEKKQETLTLLTAEGDAILTSLDKLCPPH